MHVFFCEQNMFVSISHKNKMEKFQHQNTKKNRMPFHLPHSGNENLFCFRCGEIFSPDVSYPKYVCMYVYISKYFHTNLLKLCFHFLFLIHHNPSVPLKKSKNFDHLIKFYVFCCWTYFCLVEQGLFNSLYLFSLRFVSFAYF